MDCGIENRYPAVYRRQESVRIPRHSGGAVLPKYAIEERQLALVIEHGGGVIVGLVGRERAVDEVEGAGILHRPAVIGRIADEETIGGVQHTRPGQRIGGDGTAGISDVIGENTSDQGAKAVLIVNRAAQIRHGVALENAVIHLDPGGLDDATQVGGAFIDDGTVSRGLIAREKAIGQHRRGPDIHQADGAVSGKDAIRQHRRGVQPILHDGHRKIGKVVAAKSAVLDQRTG